MDYEMDPTAYPACYGKYMEEPKATCLQCGIKNKCRAKKEKIIPTPLID